MTKKEIAFNGKKLTMEEFSESLKETKTKKIPVVLRVDESVEYKKVVKVIDLLKKYKLENLNLITEKE